MRLQTRALIVVFAICCCAGVYGQGDKNTEPTIQGRWSSRDTEQCRYVITFAPDGTILVESGEEILKGTYALVRTPALKAFGRLTRTITYDNGGRDCQGSTRNDAGQSASAYAFLDNADTLRLCFDAEAKRCFGLFVRAQ